MNREFAIRFLLIATACVAGWLAMDLQFLPVWLALYFGAAMVEKRVAGRTPSAHPKRDFALLWCISFVLASVFAVLPVLVWNIDNQSSKFAAALLFSGAVLNIFLLRARNWLLGAAYLLPICGAAYWITGSFFLPPSGGVEFWLCALLCVCLTVYFGVCLYEADRNNTELKRTRAQFIQAQKVEAIGTLTSGVAHDFNNLLSVIQGNLELLKSYPDAPDRDVFLDEALTAAKRGADLTHQLTAHGRKSAQKVEEMDPATALRDVREMATRVLPANIHLHLRFAGTESRIVVDQTTLNSALLNLVINARDAMPEGGDLTISLIDPTHPPDAMKLLSSTGYIAFVVRDTGTGIPETLLEKVRDPFFSTKPTGQGSGLGLPMVSGFALQSGGDIEIQSAPGAGTTIRLFLPKA